MFCVLLLLNYATDCLSHGSHPKSTLRQDSSRWYSVRVAQAHLCLSGTQVWLISARKTVKVAGSQAGSGEEHVPSTLRRRTQGEMRTAGCWEEMLPLFPRPRGEWTLGPQLPMMPDLGPDEDSSSPTSWSSRPLMVQPLSCHAVEEKIFLRWLPNVKFIHLFIHSFIDVCAQNGAGSGQNSSCSRY